LTVKANNIDHLEIKYSKSREPIYKEEEIIIGGEKLKDLDGNIYYLKRTNDSSDKDAKNYVGFSESSNKCMSNIEIDKAVPFYFHKVPDSPNTYKLFGCV
jgi:hypothetical protein